MEGGAILGLFILAGIALSIVIYFIPTIVAFKRQHVNRISILLVNLFLGWSLLGWVVAIAWAFTTTGTQTHTHMHINNNNSSESSDK